MAKKTFCYFGGYKFEFSFKMEKKIIFALKFILCFFIKNIFLTKRLDFYVLLIIC